MPLILIEDTQEYVVEETVFVYERLRYDDRAAIQYLASTRGSFNQDLYNKICVAVALKGWRELYGQNGLLAWPALEPSPPLTVHSNGTQALATALLFPGVAPARQRQLEAVLAVVERLPMVVVIELSQRVNEYEPEALKKSSPIISGDALALPTGRPAQNLPAPIADASGPKMD